MKKLRRLLYLKLARRVSRSKSSMPVPSIISENTKLKGDVISDGIIHIDGHVEGDISCEELVVGIKGIVSGKVNAKSLHLYGGLNGKAEVKTLFVSKSAKLVGDALYDIIAIEPGAYVEGHCQRAGGPIKGGCPKPDLLLQDKRKSKKTVE